MAPSAQFFAMAAQMMRRILVDAARANGAHKRGGGALKVNHDETALLSPAPDRSILALDGALTAFAAVAPRQAKAVELRSFGRRDWDVAKAWLVRESGHRKEPPV